MPAACDLLKEPELGAHFSTLLPKLRPGKRRGQLQVPRELAEECERIERGVSNGPSSLYDRLLEWTRSHLATLAGDGERAAVVGAARERARAAEQAEQQEHQRARWDALRATAPPAWSRSRRFAAGDALVHATFGVGKVIALAEPDKIVVKFEDGQTRTLVHASARLRQ